MLSRANLCEVTRSGEEKMSIPGMLFRLLLAVFQGKLELAAANLALRQQLAIVVG